MRFLYVAPRYHTNQVPIIRGLKRKGHEVCFFKSICRKSGGLFRSDADSDRVFRIFPVF